MKKEIKFVLFGEYILVEMPEIKKETEGGIIKSDEMIKIEKDKMAQNVFLEVMKVGNGDSVDFLKEGDKVFVAPGNHAVLPLDGVNYMLVHGMNIYGKQIK